MPDELLAAGGDLLAGAGDVLTGNGHLHDKLVGLVAGLPTGPPPASLMRRHGRCSSPTIRPWPGPTATRLRPGAGG
jgi:hypothetical protein